MWHRAAYEAPGKRPGGRILTKPIWDRPASLRKRYAPRLASKPRCKTFLVAVVLVSQGVVQTLGHSVSAHGVQGFDQTIARGPAAGQISIKQLGTNGGGFFNVNSAHPFENPTPLSNFVEMFSILWIAAALTYTFGKMVASARQGWALFAAMWILMVAGIALTVPGERHATPAMEAAGVSASAPNLEGKEVRIGPDESSLWAVVTTDASNGSVNAMHDSFQPLGAVAPMFNMAIGEVVYGGVGSGLYGMLFYVVVAVFIGGLMVGRTPEYLGKKIRAREVKIVVVAILVPFLVVLALTAVGRLSSRPGSPHGRTRGRTGSARSCTPSSPRATTTGRPSPGSRPAGPSTRSAGGSPC